MADAYSFNAYFTDSPAPTMAVTANLDDGTAFDHTTNASGNQPDYDIEQTAFDAHFLTENVQAIFDAPREINSVEFTTKCLQSYGPASVIYEVFRNDGGIYTSLGGSTVNSSGFTDITFPVDPPITCDGILVTVESTIGSLSPLLGMAVYYLGFDEVPVDVCTVPGQVTGLLLYNGVTTLGGTLEAEWTAPETGDLPFTYEVWRTTDIFMLETTDTYVQLTGLENGETYCLYVIARNDCGDGTPSETLCLLVDDIEDTVGEPDPEPEPEPEPPATVVCPPETNWSVRCLT